MTPARLPYCTCTYAHHHISSFLLNVVRIGIGKEISVQHDSCVMFSICQTMNSVENIHINTRDSPCILYKSSCMFNVHNIYKELVLGNIQRLKKTREVSGYVASYIVFISYIRIVQAMRMVAFISEKIS